MSQRMRKAILLAVVFAGTAGFYWGTFSFRGITDTRLNSLQTRALLKHADVDLSRYGLDEDRFFVVRRGEDLYSVYGVGVSVVAAPVYAPLMAAGVSENTLEGAVGMVFAAGAVTAMYGLLTRHFTPGMAAAGTIVLGFGTTVWPLATMAFWQQAPVVFLETLGLAALLSDRPRAPLWCGLAFGVGTFVRPSVAVVMLFVGFYYLRRDRRALGLFIAGASVPLLGIAVQNRWIWGSWLFGGYSNVGFGLSESVPSGLFGELLGFWRGLFVYSPVLVLGLVGIVVAMEVDEGIGKRLVYAGAGAALLMVMYAGWTWWGGENQFGYRYLLEIVPILVVLSCHAVARKPRLMTLAVPLAVVSILTMTFGTAPHRAGWDLHAFTGSFIRSPVGQAWIAFLDSPSGGLLRLAGIGAFGVFLRAAARRVAGRSLQQATDLPG